MARRLFYVELTRGGRAEIRGETAAHLRRVLRAEPGRKFEVSDNQTVWLAEIASLGRDAVEFELLEAIPPRLIPARFHLFASLVKFDRFEWILEKATELGAETITPVVAARSEPGLDEGARKRTARWRRILFESGQQARRACRPLLGDVSELAAVLDTAAEARFWLDEQPGSAPILDALPQDRRPTDRVCLLVGPEGGWETAERDLAAARSWHCVSLGPQILRSETAALSGLAILSATWQALQIQPQ